MPRRHWKLLLCLRRGFSINLDKDSTNHKCSLILLILIRFLRLESLHLKFLGRSQGGSRFSYGQSFKPVFQFGGSFQRETVLVHEVGVPSVLPYGRLPLLKLGPELPALAASLTFLRYSFSCASLPLS